MLIIEQHGTSERRTVPESQIGRVCLLLAADNPERPTDKEQRRAAVYHDRIMKQGRHISAGGFTVWRE